MSKLNENCTGAVEELKIRLLSQAEFSPPNDAKTIIQEVNSFKWEKTQYACRGELTSLVSGAARKARKLNQPFVAWNDALEDLDRIWPDLKNTCVDKIRILFPNEGSDWDSLSKSIHWDAVTALMSVQYHTLGLNDAIVSLTSVILAGRFPYGWNGQYPNGSWLVA